MKPSRRRSNGREMPDLGQRLHLPEARERQGRERGLRAARHRLVGVPVGDQPSGDPDRVRARRAGGHGAERLSAQAVLHRRHAAGGVGHQDRYPERRDLVGPALLHDRVLLLDRGDAPDPGADDARAAIRVSRRRLVPAGVGQGLARRGERELGEAVRAPDLLHGQVLAGVELVAPPEPVLDPGAARGPALVRVRAPTPSGVTAPTPVITTSRFTRASASPGPPPAGRS